MEKEIRVPKLGESITSVVLTTWLKSNGAYVEEGEDILELESDKAAMAIPAPAAGVLKQDTAVESEVDVGQVIGRIDTSGGKPEKGTGRTEPDGEKTDSPDQKLSPAVRRILAEHDLTPGAIEGTGKKGRILKEDALKAAAQEAPGRASPGDFQEETVHTPVQPPGDRQKRVKMSRLRETIARNLVRSRQDAAHLTTFNEINLQRVMDIRKKYREPFQEAYGIKLGFMSFFVKGCCAALQKFPAANCFLDGTDIVYNNYYHIGIAVSTEPGLVVPVLKDADRLGFDHIEKQIASFADRARERRITIDELTGGTFSITNGGIFGSLLSTPIPTPPQSAILGMHTIQQRPVAEGGEVVIRPMMYVALTYDHRVMDGREAVGFLITLKTLLEEPERLFLKIP